MLSLDVFILIENIENSEHFEMFKFTMDRFLYKNVAKGKINVNIPRLLFCEI